MTSKLIPHPPKRLPLVGDILGMDREKPMQNTLRRHRELGPIYQRIIFGQPIVFVAGHDLVAEINNDKLWEKHVGRPIEALRSVAGDALFTAYNDEPNWQKAHNILTPAFTQSAMRSYHDTMLDTARELVASWDTKRDRFDVADEMSKLTLETIGRTGFGHAFNAFTNEETDPFVTSMLRVLDHAQSTGMPIPGIGALVGRKAARRQKEDLDYLNSVVREAIDRRRTNGNQGATDLLDRMLSGVDEESGESLDEMNMIRQVITFMVAGHETTAAVLSFTLWFLATHPEVAQRARAEVDEMWPGRDTPDVKFEQVAKLRYLRRVLDESMRIWPTSPGYFRRARTDTTIGGKYEFKAGEWALVVVLAMHRDPAVWGENADEFDPDRFMPENVKARPAQAYKPFGTGARSCIGRQFAIHEMVMALALLLHRYEFDVEPGYELKVKEQLTLRPDGFRMSVRRRGQ